jgi:guanylate kinase
MENTQNSPLLIVVSAPSGGGKTTLCDLLLAKCPNITRAITCTTRKPREGERDGVDYFFLDRETFQSKVAAGEFLEHATVYENFYGNLKSEVLNKLHSGKHVLLNIDVQGAASIRDAAKSVKELRDSLVSVFLTPATFNELESRLRKRGSESEETLARRLKEAKVELACWDQFDYLLISSTKEGDLRRMETILEAENMRQSRAVGPKF